MKSTRWRRLKERAAECLVSDRLPSYLAILAVALCLPALGVGWQLDDNFHRVIQRGDGVSNAGPLEIFSVLRHGDHTVHEAYIDAGIFPWWTSDEFRIAFLRHLSAATSWLDYRLWPGSGPLQHAHSLLWFGAVVFAVTRLYRRIHGRTITAGLAALMFALDDAHGTAAGWLANRNALVAMLFGALCLSAHDRWRRDGNKRAAALAPLFLALGLAGGESALATAGFLLSYALFLDPAPVRSRLFSLIPSGLVLALWATLYRLLGFGASGSGLYVDPLDQPAAFLAGVVERAPLFVAGQLTPLAADLSSLLPEPQRVLVWAAALALLAWISFAFYRALRTDRTAGFWALGTALSVVPLCATFPTNRVLFFTGLGAMGLVAQWLGRPHSPVGRLGNAATKLLSALLIFTHLILAPLLLPPTAAIMKRFGAPVEEAVLSVPDDQAIAEQELLVVNAPDYLLYVSQIPALLQLENRSRPNTVRGLAIGPSAVTAARTDPRTLEVTMANGFLHGPLGELYRHPSDPLAAGDSIDLPGMTATVLDITSDNRPSTVRFRFDQTLDSPAYRWVRFEADRYIPFDPPRVGDSITLPAARGPFELLFPP